MEKQETLHQQPRGVSGAHHGLYVNPQGDAGTFDPQMAAAMSAVIVNPQASPLDRLRWAMGQVTLTSEIADIVYSGDEPAGPLCALAASVHTSLAQVFAVLESVADDLEREDAMPAGRHLSAV